MTVYPILWSEEEKSMLQTLVRREIDDLVAWNVLSELSQEHLEILKGLQSKLKM